MRVDKDDGAGSLRANIVRTLRSGVNGGEARVGARALSCRCSSKMSTDLDLDLVRALDSGERGCTSATTTRGAPAPAVAAVPAAATNTGGAPTPALAAAPILSFSFCAAAAASASSIPGCLIPSYPLSQPPPHRIHHRSRRLRHQPWFPPSRWSTVRLGVAPSPRVPLLPCRCLVITRR